MKQPGLGTPRLARLARWINSIETGGVNREGRSPVRFSNSESQKPLSEKLKNHAGQTHPPKTTHPNKNTVCANNFGKVCTNCPPFPFKISRKQAKRVCANCFYLGGWFFWVGRLPLQEGCGVLRGENPGAFPTAGPIFQQPFSWPERAQTFPKDPSVLKCYGD